MKFKLNWLAAARPTEEPYARFSLEGTCISQRHNQHRASGTLQNAVGDAAQEKVRKRTSAMGSENDEIDPQIFCLGQDQIDWDPLEVNEC